MSLRKMSKLEIEIEQLEAVQTYRESYNKLVDAGMYLALLDRWISLHEQQNAVLKYCLTPHRQYMKKLAAA